VLTTAAILLIGLASVAWAQRFRVMEGPGIPPRFPPKTFEDGTFTICRIMYSSARREANGFGWSTDYPYAAINLMIRASELTKTPISKDTAGEPQFWVVRLTDDALFRCPFSVASDVGTIGLSTQEAARLREYLLKGGFLWVDDYWGTAAAEQWSREIHKALPEYPIVDIQPDHPIRHTLFEAVEIPQVPGINYWQASGGDTSERGSDSQHVDFQGIADDHGRLMVVMSHNTDIGDSMEREAENAAFFNRFSPAGYAVTIDMVIYALTH